MCIFSRIVSSNFANVQHKYALIKEVQLLGSRKLHYWASEASPTLGCSIEISRDIYVYMCVCRGPKSVGGITWAKHAHAQSHYWAVKSDQCHPYYSFRLS